MNNNNLFNNNQLLLETDGTGKIYHLNLSFRETLEKY